MRLYGSPGGGHIFRHAGRDDPAAIDLTAVRSKVDDMIGGLHDLQVVLNYDDRIPLFDKREGLRQPRTSSAKSGCRLVQDIEYYRLPGVTTPLPPRCASPPDNVGRLADLYVAETNTLQGDQFVANAGNRLEKVSSFFNRHIQNVSDRLIAELDFQSLIVAFAFTGTHRTKMSGRKCISILMMPSP